MIPIAFVENRTSGVVEIWRPDWAMLSECLARCDIGKKDGRGWMPADIDLGQRSAERVKSVSLLVLDVEADAENVKDNAGKPLLDANGDHIKRYVGPEPPAPDAMIAELGLWGWRCILHTSYSHSPEHPRHRLTFALSRPLNPYEVKALGLHVAALIGIGDCIDTGCLEPARLFYTPRCPAERIALFRHAETKGEPLPVDELLAEASKIGEVQKSSLATRRTGQSGNVIQAFNDASDVGLILEQHGYQPRGRRRWLWPGSTSGLPGVRLLPDSTQKRAYSSHGGDPLNDGHAHDAFDLWKILRHGGDVSAAVKDAAQLVSMDEGSGAGDIPADDAADKDGKSDKPSAAKALIELAVKNCDLFHDERSDGYAVTVHNGVRRTLKLRGREFRRWLAGTFYAKTEKAANSEAISSALGVLEAKATFDGRMLELSNRFAMRNGVIYIDMADEKWRVIKVTAGGWEVMTTPPVLFRRYSHQKALPDPAIGGKLSDLHNHLAIKSDDDKVLVMAWAVAAAFPDAPRPAITFHGPQGASKTSTARVLKSVTDPSLTESVDLGKSPADLAQVLDHHGVPCFDNLSSIPGWAADMLCRGVTGGAFSKRELYSDDSDVILSFKRPMIITGINIPTHAPDLLDRLLLIELERISPDSRMDESTFWARFNADKPMLFGALLDGIAGALKHLPSIKLDVMPRMADFARIACAYAEFAGIGSERMLSTIMAHTTRQTQEVLDSDPVASAIQDLIQTRGSWEGTAGELLELLNESQPSPRPDGWPKQANNLTRKINVLHATLNEAGISIRKHKEGSDRKKLLTLERRANSSSASSASSRSPIHAGFEAEGISGSSSRVSFGAGGKAQPTKSSSALSFGLNPSVGAGLGDRDGKDDKSGVLSDPVVEVEV